MAIPELIPIADPALPYEHAIVLVGGFTQHRNQSNGTHASFDDAYRRYASPQTRIEYFPWFVDPREIATGLAEMAEETFRVTGQRLRIMIGAYSFGGYTAAEIARILFSITPITVEIDELVLVDPVGRWLGRFGWSRAMWPSQIRIAPIVNRVRWIRQRNPRFRCRWPFFFPSSHDVVIESEDHTELIGPIELSDDHVDIDNATKTRIELVNAIERTIRPTIQSAA